MIVELGITNRLVIVKPLLIDGRGERGAGTCHLNSVCGDGDGGER